MRMWKPMVLVLSTVAAAAGCSQSPTEQKAQDVFDHETGGLSTENEAPAFGDDLLLAAVADEQDPADPEAAQMEADLAADPDLYRVFALRVLWGQLRFDSTSVTPTVWDGALAVASGRIGVRRTIRFEPATDALLPRTEPGTVRWTSTTTVHNDGLLLLIGVNTAMLVDSANNEVSFRTGPLSLRFQLRELAALDTVIRVDEAGNAVLLHSFIVSPDQCPRGFLGGHWMLDSTGSAGEFKGRWINRNGELAGYLMGRFGVNSEGRRVLFAKYIDEDGRFEGMLRGIWGKCDFEPGVGHFGGVFYDPLDRPAGRLHGRWQAESRGTGMFQGAWHTACPHWEGLDWRWDNWQAEDFDPACLDESEVQPGTGG